jgi:hypothetical protein
MFGQKLSVAIQINQSVRPFLFLILKRSSETPPPSAPKTLATAAGNSTTNENRGLACLCHLAALQEWRDNICMKKPLIAIAIAILIRSTAVADSIPLPTVGAMQAKAIYASELAKAKAEYDQSVQTARRKYLASLEGEKLATMKAGNLDAANAIQAEMNNVHQSPTAFTSPTESLQIRKAVNGADHQWFDVTDLIRSRVNNGAINGYPPLPGVANVANTLTIDGTLGSQDFELSVNAADVGGTLRFGRVGNANGAVGPNSQRESPDFGNNITGNNSASPPATNSQALAPQTTQPSGSANAGIPSNISYSVISTDELPDNGRRLQIRINKMVSKDVLRIIALKLKADEPHPFNRTFILYYLPDMTPGHGAWATTDFDPDLDVQILGFTPEQAAKIASTSPSNQDLIGKWIDNFPGSSCIITIYRANGKLLMDRKFQDGSGGTTPLVEKQSPLGRQFEDAEGSDTGDNFVLTPEGDLQLRDNTGLIDTAKPVK